MFFRAGTRKNEQTQPIVEQLNNEDIRNLGAYYASLPPPKTPKPDDNPDLSSKGAQAAVGWRCASCHMDTFAGTKAVARVANVQEVARGIGMDNRIGSKFLHAGPGFGGSCFPKDTRALIKTAQDYDAPLRTLEVVNSVNDTRKRAMARKVAAPFGGNLRGKTIAVLGLTFKPNTDDMREAPSIPIITALQDMGATVRSFDPVGMELARIEMPDIPYSGDPYECAAGADALVIVTEWEQFRALDLDRLKREMACPVIVDLRNVYDPNELTKRGFLYQSIGRAG